MRKRLFLLILASLLIVLGCSAAPKDKVVVGFYNVENLFDTVHDEGKSDQQFLPDGQNLWTEEKYASKLGNIARVINEMATENGGVYHSVLGLAEVENDRVLGDLVSHKSLASAGYKFIHFESPDARGIDCALLYRPSDFKPLESRAIPFDFLNTDIRFEKTPAEQAEFATRDVLMVRGKLKGEMFAFFVAHLPSRIGDKGSDLRERGAEIIHRKAMELMAAYPGIKIVVMGDMNDNPGDESMSRYLRGADSPEGLSAKDFFNPFVRMHRDGLGSEEYRGEWNIFDIIMVNSTLCNPDIKGLKISRIGDKYHGRIFNPAFLTQQSGKYKGTPLRTFSAGAFINGYSDHYPTYIILTK